MMFARMFDDAALFPPGDAPAELAVPAHHGYRQSAYSWCVGPFIAPAVKAKDIAALARSRGFGYDVDLALTYHQDLDRLGETISAATRFDGVRVVAVEVAVGPAVTATQAVEAIESSVPETVTAFLEVPRDDRRSDVLAALADSRVRAKFRTGGTVAAAYPGEPELAAAIQACVRGGIAFKATAGLHRAIRNTAPATGFEQHGFLNIVVAVHAAHAGAGTEQLAEILASRDAGSLAHDIADLGPGDVTRIRGTFLSFGTCSIIEPIEDLIRLDLLPSGILATTPGAHA